MSRRGVRCLTLRSSPSHIPAAKHACECQQAVLCTEGLDAA